jgi:hypothetical protein
MWAAAVAAHQEPPAFEEPFSLFDLVRLPPTKCAMCLTYGDVSAGRVYFAFSGGHRPLKYFDLVGSL